MVSEHFERRTRAPHEVVHHKNEVKTDNRPENLEMIPQVEHVTHHANEFWSDKEALMRAGHRRWSQDPERKAAAYQGRSMPFMRSDVTVEAILDTIRQGAKNRAESARILECDWNVIQSRLVAEKITFPELVATVDNNHKVRAIVPVVLDTPVPVYDLEVDEWSNFALSGGVFVHNSKDLADAFGCSVVQASLLGGEEDADGRSEIQGTSGDNLFESGSFEEPFSLESGALPGGGFGLPMGMGGFGGNGW